MKRLIFILPLLIAAASIAQNNNMSIVNMGKPKQTQKLAFEAAYKLHVAKFHKGNENNNTYEILSGANTGAYFFVNSGRSRADLDNERADAVAHRQDLEKNFFPFMEETFGTQMYIFQDSMSFHSDLQADKYVVNVRHIKQGTNLGDYRRELARSVKILGKMKGAFWDNLSFSIHEMLWDGSDQVFVQIRNLKTGFKELEPGYFGPAPAGAPSFRDEYVKEYGYDAWDERVKILDNAVEKNDQYIMKHRKDLSSQ